MELTVEPKFEVVGNVCSLLNVTIPASWPLYTRRGTLVSIRGQIENVPHIFLGKTDVVGDFYTLSPSSKSSLGCYKNCFRNSLYIPKSPPPTGMG